jgi:hypothetical protein
MIGLNKEVDNNPQSQTNAYFQYLLIDEKKTDIGLTSPVAIDDEVINVTPGHGFTGADDEYLVIRNGDLFEQTRVKAVNGDAISVSIPMPIAFSVGADIIRGNSNMAVDGSVTPLGYKYSSNCCGDAEAITPIDISEVKIIMTHTTEPDDSRFGNIAGGLADGMYIRKVNGERVNLGNYRTNLDFKKFGAKVEYTDKAGAGNFATEITFAMEEVFGSVQRINPRDAQYIVAFVRANIALLTMEVSLLGSFTEGE